jgi:hypothetical protein
MEKMIYAFNHFSKFTKRFWSNRNHFTVDYYLCPYQTPKNAEIIFQKPFYGETNGELDYKLEFLPTSLKAF